MLYAKMFIGMGFIWTFEILAGLVEGDQRYWYFTDILNMCQGFYIFIVFVCKRNVFNMVFAQDTPQGKTSRNAFQQIVAQDFV